MEHKRAGIRQALYLASVSAAARAPGFLVPLLIATVFGAGPVTDAYFLVYSGVLLVGGTLGQGVEVAMVPFAARLRRENPTAIRVFLRRAAIEAAMAASVAWVVAIPLLSLGAQSEIRSNVIGYSIVFAPLAVVWCSAGVYAGALIAQWSIARASGSMLWRGAGALLGLALWPLGVGLAGVALGLGFGELLRLRNLKRAVTAPEVESSAPVSLMRPFRQAAGALILAWSTGSAVPVIERMLAGGLGPGSISHLEYAYRLLIIPTLLFDGGLGPLLLARWSNNVASTGKRPGLKDVIKPVGKGMLMAAACAIPLAVFARQIVELVLQHGQFSQRDAISVAELLRILSVGFVSSMGALLLERMYFASTRNSTLVILSLLRAFTRLGLIMAFLGQGQLKTFGFAYAIAETVYLFGLIALANPRKAVIPVSSGLARSMPVEER